MRYFPWLLPAFLFFLPAAKADSFGVDVATDGEVLSGAPLTLHLTLRKGREKVAPSTLELVHEKPLHFVVVSADLAHFEHEHPEPQPDGRLDVKITFPTGGAYLLFSEFSPRGAGRQVVTNRFYVPGKAPKRRALVDSVKEKFNVAGMSISLRPTPQKLKVGDATLKYELGVADLQPYLGAGGHSILISEDGTRFLHAHPAEHQHGEHRHAAAKASYGPEVTFATTFPKPGIYKAWAQFRRAGRIVTVEHVLSVAP